MSLAEKLKSQSKWITTGFYSRIKQTYVISLFTLKIDFNKLAK